MVIPVVIGALGTMSKRIVHKYKKKIEIPSDIISIQKTAMLGISSVLRRVLGI